MKSGEDLDTRIHRLYMRRIDAGLTPGRAVHCLLNFISGVNSAEIRAALARKGVIVEDGRQSGISRRWMDDEPKKAKLPKPKPQRSAPTSKAKAPAPVTPVIRREYTDEGGCVMPDPRDLLAGMPGYGQAGRYVSPAALYAKAKL